MRIEKNIRGDDGKIDPDLLVNNLVQLFSILVHNGMSLSRQTNGADQATVKPLPPEHVGNFRYSDNAPE